MKRSTSCQTWPCRRPVATSSVTTSPFSAAHPGTSVTHSIPFLDPEILRSTRVPLQVLALRDLASRLLGKAREQRFTGKHATASSPAGGARRGSVDRGSTRDSMGGSLRTLNCVALALLSALPCEAGTRSLARLLAFSSRFDEGQLRLCLQTTRCLVRKAIPLYIMHWQKMDHRLTRGSALT